MDTAVNILLVDDDPKLKKILSDILRAKGYTPTFTATGKEALDSIRQEKPDIALIELRLEDMSGLDVMKEIKKYSPDTECILITGQASQASAIESIHLGAYSYILKPYNLDQLLLTIHRALEKRKAEKALQESQRRIATLMSNLPGMAYRCKNDPDWTMEFVSDGCQPLTGYKPEDLLDNALLSYADIIHLADRRMAWNDIQDALKDKRPFQLIYRIITATGEEKWVWEQGRGVFGKKGNLIALEGFITDITERKRIELALRESETQYRDLMENAPLGVLSVDRQGRIVEVNSQLVQLLGSPSVEATKRINLFTFQPLVATGVADHFRQCLENGEAGVFETPYTSKWGHPVYLRCHIRPIEDRNHEIVGVQGIVEDISNAKQIETQLRQAQKMEAIGTLAGGIAHDFNNILAAIIGYSELALTKVELNSSLYSDLQEVFKAGIRAKELVKQILTFSRQTEQKLKPVQIKLIIKEALKLLRASLPTSIEIRQNLRSTNTVLADPTQIHQILMNLCTNAGHAMRDKGGILQVNLMDEELDAEFAARHPDITPGSYMKLSVADTGHGIPSEILQYIFDPFFTTKKREEGTGMGLSVVHGIVKGHEGTLTVSSEPEKGSIFNVYLPVIESGAQLDIRATEPLPTGTEQVLFVDDEKLLADLGKQMLERYGYRVSLRTSSVEALELFNAKPDQFDLVITDMTMPNMSGLELAAEIIGRRPEMPIILCTGFSERVSQAGAEAAGIRAFMMKPVSLDGLIRTVRQVLDDVE